MPTSPHEPLPTIASLDESSRSTRTVDPTWRVFVVDDDPTIRRALERLLRSAGHAVETFASAKEFLARSPRPTAGALILDARMPGMSGLDLQRRLALERCRLPIFFLSSVDDARTRATAIAEGALAWFSKPLDAEVLLAALDSKRSLEG